MPPGYVKWQLFANTFPVTVQEGKKKKKESDQISSRWWISDGVSLSQQLIYIDWSQFVRVESGKINNGSV